MKPMAVYRPRLYPSKAARQRLFGSFDRLLLYNYCLANGVHDARISASRRRQPPTGGKAIGIDLGASNLSTDSDGLVVGRPRSVRKASRQLARQERKLSRKIEGSRSRCKQRHSVAVTRAPIGNRRNDFLHNNLSRYHVDNHDLICLECLNIKGSIQVNCSSMRKLMQDAGWDKITRLYKCKAERAGKRIVFANPGDAPQRCSARGEPVRRCLSERTHSCPFCTTVLNRGYSGSQNILNDGLSSYLFFRHYLLCYSGSQNILNDGLAMAGWGRGTPEPSCPDRGALVEIKAHTLADDKREQALVEEARISRFRQGECQIIA